MVHMHVHILYDIWHIYGILYKTLYLFIYTYQISIYKVSPSATGHNINNTQQQQQYMHVLYYIQCPYLHINNAYYALHSTILYNPLNKYV